MNRQRLAALIAAVVLLAALAWWQTSDPQVATPGKPVYNGPISRGMKADVQPLPGFGAFYVNLENPFVPFNQREHDKHIEDPPPRPPTRPPAPTRPTVIPPRPPVLVTEYLPKPVDLPRLAPAAATAPQCIGLIGGEESQLLVVRMPGAEGSVTLKVGQTVDGWTLVLIDNSNQAHFTDPSGATEIFPIGDGDLAVAQTLVTPASDAPMKPAKPGEGALIKDLLGVPKPNQPGQGQGQGNGAKKPRRPGGQGGQGGQGMGQGQGQGAGNSGQ
jgi:hypothetical protein